MFYTIQNLKEKLNLLDTLEILSFDDHRTEYPIHYHETYCISLIQKGVFGENELLIPTGSILISHPNEIHHNKLVENIGVSFTTFYVSKDVIDSISPFQFTSFENKIVQNSFLWNQLNSLIKLVSTSKKEKNFTIDFYTTFYQTISLLIQSYGHDKPYSTKESSEPLDSIKYYIKENLNSKINLTALAKIVDMSKYQFTRWFKSNVGITPFEYVLLKRVGFGKRLIQEGVPLVDASLDAGFYDQSHFSNYFKKYVGMSPSVYKNSCNIFQDI